MQLGSRRQSGQTEQDLGPVSSLLRPEEDNGLAASEGPAAQGDQDCLLVTNSVALQKPFNMNNK